MTLPGATAEASLYRSEGAYRGSRAGAAARADRMLRPQQTGFGQLVPRLAFDLPLVVLRPCRPPWLCQIEYWLCQGQIPRCIDRCLSNNFFRCAFASDPQACEARVRQICAGQCQVACDAAYASCLQCR